MKSLNPMRYKKGTILPISTQVTTMQAIVLIMLKNGNRWEDILVAYHLTDREYYPLSNLINAVYVPYVDI